jgi:hypothetical protein
VDLDNYEAFAGNDSSEDEESEGSDLDELKNLNLPNGDGLSVADVIQQAKLQLNTVSAKAAQIFHFFFYEETTN